MIPYCSQIWNIYFWFNYFHTYMSKVRVELEDIFIENDSWLDEISEKYHYTFNSKWIANNNSTKRIAIRKIKSFLWQ
ncbi:MAG: hypothetical protein Ta2E_01820 [Mycoplasmoidaceae bacterium]|nr:MAG: hypothetical protein Ta2E_01820 [Mycoplasmoidaceae bacterium]